MTATIENITIKIGSQVISLTHEQWEELRVLLSNCSVPLYFHTGPTGSAGSSGLTGTTLIATSTT
ncbi:MAG: hypothetical protein KAS32_18690 [Candidatus Peribacteraceae bacterium]|nr:hypothetical protein [Candidatus Peribacteraceae bacterium]